MAASNSSRMGWKHRNLALKLPLNLLSLVLLCQTLDVAARSVAQRSRPNDNDPMMALPSGRSEQSQQEVKFVSYQPAGPYAAMAPVEPASRQMDLMADHQPETQPEQQYEMVQVRPRANEQGGGQAEDCNQRHEFSALLDQRPESGAGPSEAEQSVSPDYAGQLVYVSQGGHEADRFKSAAASWSQATDLSATILTEIPVKDMPAEVLRKLKRDFGVKVVATRDRPGANLVINCDEYSDQENSICSRHLASQEAAYQPHPSERPQVGTVVPLAMPPRQGAASFHHVEHIVQPASEPNQPVYVPESLTESYHQTGEDSRGANEPSRPAIQEGEQVGSAYEFATPATSQTGAYEAEQQQHENSKETPHLDQSTGQHQPSDEQDEPTSYEQTNRSALEGRGQESRELSGGGFDEQQQQHNDHEAHWRQNLAGDQTTMRRANSAEWQAPNHDYVKQVDSGETSSAAAAAHQTSR